MKQLSSFLALNVNGGDRISFTYDVVNDETGAIESSNNKESFVVTTSELRDHVDAIRDYIRQHKLTE